MARSDRFLNACRHIEPDCTPIWIMRQAGRYLEEYRAIRAKHSFLEMCKTPELAVEITLQPIRRFDLDAAIIFSDILLPLEKMGIPIAFAEGEGPVLSQPVRTKEGVSRIHEMDPEQDMAYLMRAIEMTKQELNGLVPLIGFSGAPFTLASYAIEGGGSKHYVHTKSLMYNDPKSFHLFMEKLASMIATYLNTQIRHGAQAVQVFDSWVGCLSAVDYREYILPHMKQLFSSIDKSVPSIHFAVDALHLLPMIREGGGDVIGLDWRTPLDEAWKVVGHDRAVQGNLEPLSLFGSYEYLEHQVDDILSRAAGQSGHIFNLGHGIMQGTPVEAVTHLVELVHSLSRRNK